MKLHWRQSIPIFSGLHFEFSNSFGLFPSFVAPAPTKKCGFNKNNNLQSLQKFKRTNSHSLPSDYRRHHRQCQFHTLKIFAISHFFRSYSYNLHQFNECMIKNNSRWAGKLQNVLLKLSRRSGTAQIVLLKLSRRAWKHQIVDLECSDTSGKV